MVVIRKISDYVKLLNNAVSLIYENIKRTRKDYLIIKIKKDDILLSIFDKLNDETIYYDGDSLDFEHFIKAIVRDTKRWIIIGSKINTHNQVKTILIKIMAAIRNIITKKDVPKELQTFIKEEHGYNICNKDSINLLNFLINFRFYHDMNTRELLESLYPALIEDAKIIWNVIPDPPEIINAKSNAIIKAAHNYTRKNDYVKREEKREEKKEEKREEKKEEKREEKKEEKREEKKEEKREEKKEEKREEKKEYPFGAKAQRSRRTRRLRR